MSKIEINPLESPSAQRFYEKCNKTAFPYGFSSFGPGKCTLRNTSVDPEPLREILEFKTRQSDVWILSFPKCGSTWLQEMVWLVGNNLDFEGAKTKLHKRVPFIGSTKGRTNVGMSEAHHELEGFNEMPEDKLRFIKTHLPYSLLPSDTSKVRPRLIYIVRNPKDTCVSYYHFQRASYGYTGTLEDFCEAFMTDNVPYAPFWSHLKSYWEVKDQPNILILKYEDMKKDLRNVVLRTAKFLGTDIANESDMEKLLNHLSFDEMKNNPHVSVDDINNNNADCLNLNADEKYSFYRKGQVGSGKEEMSEETNTKFNQWISENGIKELYSL